MLSKRAINVIIKHYVIALLVKKSSVDVDSKELVKTVCYFPLKTRHTEAVDLTTVQINILLQKLWIAMHGNKHVDMLS